MWKNLISYMAMAIIIAGFTGIVTAEDKSSIYSCEIGNNDTCPDALLLWFTAEGKPFRYAALDNAERVFIQNGCATFVDNQGKASGAWCGGMFDLRTGVDNSYVDSGGNATMNAKVVLEDFYKMGERRKE